MTLAVLLAAASHVAATVGFVGFVPERVNLWHALLAQVVAASSRSSRPAGSAGSP